MVYASREDTKHMTPKQMSLLDTQIYSFSQVYIMLQYNMYDAVPANTRLFAVHSPFNHNN